MAGEQLATPDPKTRTLPRPGRHRLLVVATAVAVLCIGAAASPAQEGTGAGGTSAPRALPPTAAEVEQWEAEFLREEGGAKRSVPAPLAKAPGGGLFPGHKVLSLYGAAGGFGVLGRKSLKEAGAKLNRQIKPYRRQSNEPMVKAFDLVSVIATQCSGRRDECRARVSHSTIRRYLNKIRSMEGRLIVDIQPGRADVLDEMDYLREFIRQPDVDVAIDAEWNMGKGEEPGEDEGSIRAVKINAAIDKLKRIMKARDLPPKALIIHQFRKESVKERQNIHKPDNVDVTINFDGIGSKSAKRAGYREISTRRLFNGFSLFYQLDDGLMKPSEVLDLRPQADYVMYQ